MLIVRLVEQMVRQLINGFQYDSPVGVYNTATHSYQNLTADQLASLDALEALAQDPNNAVLFGESMQNASGFMNAQDLIQSIQK